jgi:hypothetical protein
MLGMVEIFSVFCVGLVLGVAIMMPDNKPNGAVRCVDYGTHNVCQINIDGVDYLVNSKGGIVRK